MPARCKKWLVRWILLLLWLFPAPRTEAQLPLLGTPQESPLPAGVKRNGLLETTNVEFEGFPIFEIASPIVQDRDKPGNQTPVEMRARQIEADLEELLLTLQTADGRDRDKRTPLESGRFAIDIETVNNQVILSARGDGLPRPKNLVTVTRLDADSQQKSPESLAAEWRASIASALSRAVRSRRPEAAHNRLVVIRNLALIIAAIHLVLFLINRLLLRGQNSLREAIARNREAEDRSRREEKLRKEGPTANGPVPDVQHTTPSLRRFGRTFSLQNRFKFLALIRWLLFWIVFSLWLAGTGVALSLFPHTRKLALYLAASPFMILIALFLAGLVNRIADLLVDGFIESWRANQLFDEGDTAHAEARLTTISRVIHALKFVLIYAIAIGWVLSNLEIVPWSIVTIGAIMALALSFAVQSLLKDVVMGVLILMENQFALGDYVSIENTVGTVEYMNLRITRIRALDGRLVTVPNNLITRVENLSRGWSLITVEFDVPLTAHADAVLGLSRRIAQEMAQEPEWKEIITDPDQWSGVQKISRGAMTIAIAVQTKPLQHWEAGRELRRRIKQALDEEGFDWSVPVTVAAE